MKLKGSYFYTLREDAKDEDSKSGNLLVRSGMVKKVGAGIYMYLPLGLRTYSKLQGIVKEEMDKAGAQELLMPSLIPADYYAQSGRLESFGKDMFRLKDRKGTDLVLGPTHEELFAYAAKPMIRSYKDLPFTIYQQADKFRDEPRPRYGLIRVKEFIMKDAYSFDRDDEQLKESYDKMFNAYKAIFDRLGINYKIVNAAVGAMGGDLSEEFQALADIGEDTIVLCDSCDYASNLEVATHEYEDDIEETRSKELVETPDSKTIEEVSSFLDIDIKKTVKALLMNVDGELVVFFIRGDRDLNETKAEILLDAKEINFADDELIATSNAVPGFTGPVGLEGCKIVIDEEVKHMKNFVVGGNKEGYHYVNVNFEDCNYDIVGDISNVVEGDICPHCGGRIKFSKGIEIGNTFKLGKHYCEDMGVTYLDENGKEQVPTMGCYGIGVGRTLAAVIEQNNDEHGMILPMNIAPYKVAIVVINTKDEEIMNYANSLHDELESMGIDTILDDRDERPGVKFNDMDLIGVPIRVTIGKKFVDGQVEFRMRRESESTDVEISELVNKIKETVEKEMK
jgi:prolyl-tRNA synthetase